MKIKKLMILYTMLTICLLIVMTVAIMVGSVGLTPLTVWQILLDKIGVDLGQKVGNAQQIIIWEIRMPRVLLAAIVGAALAISGAAIQAIVRNSIADPYILGVSSGASVGATLVILVGAFSFLGMYALSISAFIFALLSIVIVFGLARVQGRTSVIRLLLAGIAVSLVFSAITNFLLMMSKQQNAIQAVMHWMLGSLAGAKWMNIWIPALALVVVFIILLINYRQLNALLMGEEAATTLGIHLEKFRLFIIVAVSLLVGVVVAISGSIGFVGLIIPHIVRMFVGSNYKNVLPFSALAGAIFLVVADIVARIVIAPQEMPIGIITALCGSPFFIWMLRKQKYSFGEGES
ncbi:FecCD family ABC transporter permease [Lysinibacillus piscis]|uniref:ABC transporter permease n=1 Tax=Lysinibacillus piscis TaxID=2518931 RepID=A0ABQ5NJA5_9BACI|nr:iron ABC transporter permease [Lysinibacillus sp. KH24]GLC88438.1 ABC transporter permease [Lysinibacillus sp. KH24]